MAAAIALPSLCHAAEPFGSPGTGALTESADEIGNTVEDVIGQREESDLRRLVRPVADPWNDFWEMVDERTGLNMTFAYTALYQAVTNGNLRGPAVGAAGDFDIVGRWLLLQPGSTTGSINEGTLGFATEVRNGFTSATPAQLGQSIGSLWGTTTGFNEQPFHLSQFWWQQRMFEDRFEFRVGKIDMSTLFDAFRFNSANHFFQNAAFSDSPAIPFPGNGLGFSVGWDPTPEWFLRYGFGEANGRKTEIPNLDFNRVEAWFTAHSAGWNGEVGKLGKGLYQATLWHSERRSGANIPSATGVALVAQQELGNGWVPFARYAFADNRAVEVRHFAAAGAVHEAPFGRSDDRFGAALGWGSPHNSNFRSQWSAEIFYRLEVGAVFRVTPHAQLFINPGKSREDLVGLVGILGRVAF